jgi:hypothetical protein
MIIAAAAIEARPIGEVSTEAMSNPGPLGPPIVTAFFTVWVCPLLSVMVRITLNVPADWYAWLTLEPVPVDPSPKSQVYV